MRFFAKLSENFWKDMLIWVLPIFAIPVLRYIQDQSHQNRKFLFVRDFFSYAASGLSFIMMKGLMGKVLKNVEVPRKDLIGTIMGTVSYLVFASAGVLKLTDWVDRKFKSKLTTPGVPNLPPPQSVKPMPPSQPLPVGGYKPTYQARYTPPLNARPGYAGFSVFRQ